MFRWLIRLASVAALTALAYGWGFLVRDPYLVGVLVLGVLTLLLLAAIVRLFRPGGVASFESGDGRPRPERRPREPVTTGRAGPPRSAPQPAHRAAPPVRPVARPSAPLWSGERPRRDDDLS